MNNQKNKKKKKKDQKEQRRKKKLKKKIETYSAINAYVNYFVFATTVFFKLITIFLKNNIINFNVFKNVLFVANAFVINLTFFDFVKI